MSEFSKLQIRAKVLSVISEITSLKQYGEDNLNSYIKELEPIDDRKFLFDLFLKELIKMEEKDCLFCSCLLKKLVPIDYIKEKVVDELKSQSLSDELKYKLVQLLRTVCEGSNSDIIPFYFEDPDKILDMETKKLLEEAVLNPESMLDFLDFISAVAVNDRNLLLSSLTLDYEGNILANILYPILYSDFEDSFLLEIINVLSDSKSSLALAPFDYLIKVSKNPEIVSACKVGLKKLKLAGASYEIADKYFKNIIKDSQPAKFFSTIPDGVGNQALLVSRIKKNGKYLFCAVVINDIVGVIDCFGFFDITQEELVKIIAKFYESEGKYEVPAEYVSSRIAMAIDLTIKEKNTFPYEFICWSVLIKDIPPIDYDVCDYVKNNCKKQSITKDDILVLLTKEYSFRWYFLFDDNEYLDNLLNKFYECDNIEILDIDTELKNVVPLVFDEETVCIWKKRIYNLIYLLMNNNKLQDADMFYTLLNDDYYLETFKQVLLQRSVLNHFVSLKQNAQDVFKNANIFKKQIPFEKNYDIKKIEKIINLIKRKWIDG